MRRSRPASFFKCTVLLARPLSTSQMFNRKGLPVHAGHRQILTLILSFLAVLSWRFSWRASSRARMSSFLLMLWCASCSYSHGSTIFSVFVICWIRNHCYAACCRDRSQLAQSVHPLDDIGNLTEVYEGFPKMPYMALLTIDKEGKVQAWEDFQVSKQTGRTYPDGTATVIRRLGRRK